MSCCTNGFRHTALVSDPEWYIEYHRVFSESVRLRGTFLPSDAEYFAIAVSLASVYDLVTIHGHSDIRGVDIFNDSETVVNALNGQTSTRKNHKKLTPATVRCVQFIHRLVNDLKGSSNVQYVNFLHKPREEDSMMEADSGADRAHREEGGDLLELMRGDLYREAYVFFSRLRL